MNTPHHLDHGLPRPESVPEHDHSRPLDQPEHISRFSDGRLDPFDNITHYIFPGKRKTLCAEPIVDDWEEVPPHLIVGINCHQCRIQEYWLPASDRLDRNVILTKVIEPRPPTKPRHLTSDDDPARGRYARPEHAQICLKCFEMRGIASNFDNLCKCDRAAWEGNPIPDAGDLGHDAHLCRSCLNVVVRSGSRWSVFYCDECRPAVVRLNGAARRCVIPYGPHSLMNGTAWSAKNGKAMSSIQAEAFFDQLQTCFSNQDTLFEFNRGRIKARSEALGFEGKHAVLVSDYVAACEAAAITKRDGFVELITSLNETITEDFADLLWLESRADVSR